MIGISQRKIFYFFLIFALLLPIPILQAKETLEQKPIKLRVVMASYLTFATYFIAQEEGFFTKEGLQVDFVKMDDAGDAMPALIQGNLDVVSGFITAAPFNAMARGAKVILAGDKGYVASTGCVFMSFVARKELVESGKLKNPAQLKGRRIVMFRGSNAAGYCTEKILEMGGLTLDDIEIVNLPNPARPEALKKGSIDLFLAFEPWVTMTTQTGHGVIWMPAQEIIPDFPTAPLIFGPSLVDKNRDTGKRFMVAYLKGVRQYNLGKTDRNLEIISKYTGLDRELLKKLCWPPIRNNGMINVESMMDFQRWATKRGYLDRVIPPNQFWDPSFIEYGNRILGTANQ